MSDNKEKLVGDKRKFSFSEDLYSIREILDNPPVTLLWTWNTGLCPHCKKKITKTANHSFYRIEILALDGKEDKDVTLNDIQIMGDTKDRRRMLLPADKYNEVLDLSKKFKNLKSN